MLAFPDLARETLIVSGADARGFLNGLVTCDLSHLDRNRGAYGLLLTKQGKIQTDLEVLLCDAGLLVGVAPGTGATILAMLERYLVMEDAELSLRLDLAFLKLLGDESEVAAIESFSALPEVVAHGRIDWPGTLGTAVVVHRSAIASGTSGLLSKLAPGARQGSMDDWNQARVRAGFPLFGVDYTPEDNPHEAALEHRAVSFSKGCYLGQEVVCMQDLRGRLKRRVITLRFSGGARAVLSGGIAPGSPVLAEGVTEAAGEVTSAATFGEDAWAIVRVRAPYFQEGSTLTVAGELAERVAPAGQE